MRTKTKVKVKRAKRGRPKGSKSRVSVDQQIKRITRDMRAASANLSMLKELKHLVKAVKKNNRALSKYLG